MHLLCRSARSGQVLRRASDVDPIGSNVNLHHTVPRPPQLGPRSCSKERTVVRDYFLGRIIAARFRHKVSMDQSSLLNYRNLGAGESLQAARSRRAKGWGLNLYELFVEDLEEAGGVGREDDRGGALSVNAERSEGSSVQAHAAVQEAVV